MCCRNESVTVREECPGLYQDQVPDTGAGTCGVRHSFPSHIIGGEDTNPGDWPWVARLLPGVCGGTLVSRRHVVTAAHCVERNSEPRSVILGDSDTTTDYDCLDAKNGVGCSYTGFTCYREGLCAPKHLNIKGTFSYYVSISPKFWTIPSLIESFIASSLFLDAPASQ